MSAYHILSLDGGGIRGLLTIILLERIEQEIPGFLSEIDLFAGTSAGGILALALSMGKKASEVRALYEEFSDIVFERTLLDKMINLWGFLGSKYSNKNLYRVLYEEFGNRTLASLSKKVLISTFDLDSTPKRFNDIRGWRAKFYHNFSGKDSDADEKVIDVAVKTATAPTFFPIYKGFIDGGVVANNPSVCALAQAINPPTGGQKLNDLRLLSLGTGKNPRFLDVKNNNLGLLQWAPHMIGLMLEGGIGLADYQCEQLLGKRYLRVNPILPHSISMDDVGSISELEVIAQSFNLSGTIFWLKRYFLAQ
jgi:patatin-like phospholipase/acyl hydrolase